MQSDSLRPAAQPDEGEARAREFGPPAAVGFERATSLQTEKPLRERLFDGNRGDWIRTSDRSAPSRVRYQTAPRPVSAILARCGLLQSKRRTGVEPASSAWKAEALPLSYRRTRRRPY